MITIATLVLTFLATAVLLVVLAHLLPPARQ